MPAQQNINIQINGGVPDTGNIDDLNLKVSYTLEDDNDFEVKKTSTAFSLTLPATKNNDKLFNTFHNSNVEDTQRTGYTSRGLMPCSITTGINLLRGYAILKEVTSTQQAEQYAIDCYGANGDWSLPLQDMTLAECCNQGTHIINDATVQGSWNYDGTNENADFLYAPVRYRKPFNDNDTNVKVMQCRPAQSVYWMLVRALRTQGYEIISNFLNTSYFKRQVLLWTFGDFLNLNSAAAEQLKFHATGPLNGGGNRFYYYNDKKWTNFYATMKIMALWNDSQSPHQHLHINNVTNLPGFDNSGTYFWDEPGPGNNIANWTYPPAINLGTITAHFTWKALVQVNVTLGSWARITAQVWVNGVATAIQQDLCYAHAATFGTATDGGGQNGTVQTWTFDVPNLNPGDNVQVRMFMSYTKSFMGGVGVMWYDAVLTAGGTVYSGWELTGITIQPGSVVDLKTYPELKNYKFMDLLRGLIDYYNLTLVTDTETKKLYIEPMFPYGLTEDLTVVNDGHFLRNHLDWTGKKDISQQTQNILYSDRERQLYLKHKPDNNDGGCNKYTLRYNTEPGSIFFQFPERFKQDKKEQTNRFFSPVMHVNMSPMKPFNGKAPQMIAMIPENVANTSKDEAETAFQPKLAYYKGKVAASVYGTYKFEGNLLVNVPLIFAVNYGPNGHKDPILTYCNQKIDNNAAPVMGVGLGMRFFLQRFVMFANGQQYRGYFRLNNNDIANWRHRERIIIDGASYFLFTIEDFNAVKDESTVCMLWKEAYYKTGEGGRAPTGPNDLQVFPSDDTVMNQPANIPAPDIPYKELLLFYTDLPQ